MNEYKEVSEQLNENKEQTQPQRNSLFGGFFGFLLFIICSIAFIPALYIPWNKTEWIDDWHYYEYSSGFFLRALKVFLIVVSVIAWVIILYMLYQSIVNGNIGDNDGSENGG